LALLAQHGECTGVLARADIPDSARDADVAGWIARTPETIDADASLAEAHRRLAANAERRLVVVGDENRLRGLLCLNHAGNGFCNAASPCADRGGSAVRTRWRVLRTSGPVDHRDGVLVAPEGKRFALGDTLTLPPPGDDTRWLVIHVAAGAERSATGVIT